MNYIEDLLSFMNSSPVNFFAVDSVKQRLENAGFKARSLDEEWHPEAGERFYVTFNGSALFAVIVPKTAKLHSFHIVAAHSDSPGFRIKPNCEMESDGGIIRLNTEVYGGPILYTWFDRPLSIAGRVILRSEDPLSPKTVLCNFADPLLIIPHLAIHFNRQVNDGNPLSKQKDMLPILGRVEKDTAAQGLLASMIAQRLGVAVDDILDFDMSLYVAQEAKLCGYDNQFVSSGRLDDLSMVHAATSALLEAANEDSESVRVMAIFDNEETGSGTKQGAASPILDYILRRTAYALGETDVDYMRAISRSFMISADNAHGVHPNYVSKQDPTNHPVLGGGPVIKINANCKYMTDADSSAVFKSICEKAGVPCQYFVNHSDVAGGSTLGNILTSQMPLRGVDMGAPLWAMHSACETASVADHLYTIKAFSQFYRL